MMRNFIIPTLLIIGYGLPLTVLFLLIFLPVYFLSPAPKFLTILLIIFSPYFSYIAVNKIKKIKHNNFDRFVNFVLSVVLPPSIFWEIRGGNLENKIFVFAIFISFFINLIIYMIFKDSVWGYFLKISKKILNPKH